GRAECGNAAGLLRDLPAVADHAELGNVPLAAAVQVGRDAPAVVGEALLVHEELHHLVAGSVVLDGGILHRDGGHLRRGAHGSALSGGIGVVLIGGAAARRNVLVAVAIVADVAGDVAADLLQAVHVAAEAQVPRVGILPYHFTRDGDRGILVEAVLGLELAEGVPIAVGVDAQVVGLRRGHDRVAES